MSENKQNENINTEEEIQSENEVAEEVQGENSVAEEELTSENTGNDDPMGNSQTKTHKKPKASFWILIAVVLALIGTAIYFAVNGNKQSAPEVAGQTETPQETEEFDKGPTYDIDFAAMKQINPDYVGRIVFDSGLVDENVVQAADNDKYLNLSWDLQNDTHGAAFLDYRNGFEDQNLIIYGHFIYKDESLMFSPLHQLKDQNNYEANKYFDLVLENETRRYQVAYVYYYPMDDNSLQYFQTNYYEDYFDPYIEAVNAIEFYDTGLELSYEDKFLTLQTCVRDHDELRLIVVGKEVAVYPNDNAQSSQENTTEAEPTAETTTEPTPTAE